MFATGSIFVAKVALPHEQSLAGGVFNTVIQIGASFGIAISTVLADRVTATQSEKLGTSYSTKGSLGLGDVPLEAVLKGYRAAQWMGFAWCMLGESACAYMLSIWTPAWVYEVLTLCLFWGSSTSGRSVPSQHWDSWRTS